MDGLTTEERDALAQRYMDLIETESRVLVCEEMLSLADRAKRLEAEVQRLRRIAAD